MAMLIFNHQLIDSMKFHAGIDNRAFCYGDGLFETIILIQNKILYFEDHLQRLSRGAAALGMNMPENFERNYLEEKISWLAESNALKGNARIKIMLWRRGSGLFTPDHDESDFIITVSEIKSQPETKIQAYFYRDIRKSFSSISSFKTCNALPFIMASLAKKAKKADEMILLDTDSHVSECTSSNIFWESNREIYTPSLETGCIGGVIRKQIIAFLKSKSIRIHQGSFKEKVLLEADSVFTSNAAGISLIRRIEDKEFSTRSDIVHLIKSNVITGNTQLTIDS